MRPLFPSSDSITMLTTESLRARAARLQQLNIGLTKEVAGWKRAESPLLDAERDAYLKHIQDGIAGLDAAWETLTKALARIDKDAAAAKGGWVEGKARRIAAGSREI